MENGVYKNVQETISNRIYTTKKIRMNLEERLVTTNKFYQFLTVYYSIILTGFSILSLIEPVDWINYAIILSSVAITVLSVYLSSQNYVQRANDIRVNYTKIAELEIKLALLREEELSSCNIDEINCCYQELLRQVENHSNIDFERTLTCKPFTYYYKVVLGKVFRFVLLSLPLIALAYYVVEAYL